MNSTHTVYYDKSRAKNFLQQASSVKSAAISIESTTQNLTRVRNRLNAIAEHFQELDSIVFRLGISTIWKHTFNKNAKDQLESICGESKKPQRTRQTLM